MNYTPRKFGIIRRRDGFTLVELIVVLVIIGILLALVIPNLTGYIDKAQATACRKNRVELEKIYRYDTLLAEAEGKTVTMSTVLAGENGTKLTCPSGGTYSYNNATGHLICSNPKHNDGIVSINPIEAGALEVIQPLLKETNKQNIFSGVDDAKTPEFIDALKEKGVDFDAMGIKSWAYYSNDAMYWTKVDINTLNKDDEVVVMKYNITSNQSYNGVYSIWKVKVKEDSNGNKILEKASNNDIEYEYGPSHEIRPERTAEEKAKKKDFDTMYEIYQRALADPVFISK